MQSLFHRSKRQAASGLIGDLNQFRTRDRAYLDFIQGLISSFTEPNEIYGNIKVTKRSEDITKVTIKDSATNAQVGFIYRNQDLYIIGLVVGTTFYVDKEVYDKLKGKLPTSWMSVINAPNIVSLSSSFSYTKIMQDEGNTVLQIGKLGDSLNQLTQMGDATKRVDILRNHLSPFVVAFAEAIRFPVVAREIQDAIRNTPGSVRLSKNLVQPLSLGHPDERTPNHVFTMYSLLLSWGKLSDRIPIYYGNSPDRKEPLVKGTQATHLSYKSIGSASFGSIRVCCLGTYSVNLEKNQLNTLLGVANSKNFQKINVAPVSRGKRDVSSVFDRFLLRNLPLLEQQVGQIGYEGNVHKATEVTSITHSPDVIGALYLLSIGMLYLYGKKMGVPLQNAQHYDDPKDAFVVAVDITNRIGCYLKSAGFELDVDYEEEVELQRRIARALIRGDGMQSILSRFLAQHYSNAKENNDSLEVLTRQLIQAMATESELKLEHAFSGDVCFQ